MKKKIFYGLYALFGIAVLLLGACQSDETISSKSNNGTNGTLSYVWSSHEDGDTTFLICKQTLRYKDKNGWQTIYPNAEVKLYPQTPVIEYDKGKDPTPIYVRSTVNSGYEGTNPRKTVILQGIIFNDGQTLTAEISSDLYAYIGETGRELIYPHVELQQLTFNSVTLNSKDNLIYPEITFNLPWQDTGNNQSGKLPITVKYAKKLVSGSDKLLKTDYLQGIDWFNDNEFSLFVEKKELWQNAGEIVAIRKTSPKLKFDLAHSEHKTKEVLNFDFNGKLTTDRTQMVDISQDGWTLKRDTVKAKISFTNNSEFFEDVFSYPFFEASYTLEGKKFDFDLSVEFKENHQITKFSDSKAQNVTTAVATFDNKRFEKEVMTSLIKKEAPDIGQSKYGKVLGYYVMAVFNPAEVEKQGNITDKAVIVHYEKGYEWGVCAYNADFPSSFTYTETSYDSFNSVAKKSADASYQLARAVDTKKSILWYDANNKQINGIDALSCMILGWKNTDGDAYISPIAGYSAEYTDNSYTVIVKAPNGKTRKFSSL